MALDAYLRTARAHCNGVNYQLFNLNHIWPELCPCKLADILPTKKLYPIEFSRLGLSNAFWILE